jgi:Crp-like helix-turn-helix domain
MTSSQDQRPLPREQMLHDDQQTKGADCKNNGDLKLVKANETHRTFSIYLKLSKVLPGRWWAPAQSQETFWAILNFPFVVHVSGWAICGTSLSTARMPTGRRSSLERIAYFLLQLHSRLRAPWGVRQSTLSQDIIGDLLGLSAPHANGMLHQLSSEHLISLKRRHIVFEDPDGLQLLA